MRSKRERSDILNNIDPNVLGSCLVVRIDKRGNINKCNEPFTKMIGKQNIDVLNTPFSMCLSRKPKIIDSWTDILLKMKYNEDVSDLELPIKTESGDDVVVSWTNFPIKNVENGDLSVLNLVGTPISTTSKGKIDKKEKKQTNKTEGEKKNNKKTKKQEATKEKVEITTSKSQNQSKKINIKKKTIKLSKKKDKSKRKEKDKNIKQKKTIKLSKKKDKSKRKEKNSNETSIIEFQEVDTKLNNDQINLKQSRSQSIEDSTLINLKEQYDALQNSDLLKNNENNNSFRNKIKNRISQKSSYISENEEKKRQSKEKQSNNDKKHQSKKLISNRSIFDKNNEEKELHFQIKNLKKHNEKLEQRNKKFEEKIQSLNFKRKEIKTFFNKNLCFVRDCINVENKRKEFRYMMDQMNQRKQKLEHLETDMILEKKEFKKKIKEFFTWREKLESLEQEIEKRRKYLEEHEAFLNLNFDKVLQYELNQPASYVTEITQESELEAEESPGIVEEDNLFEFLTVEAVVLQRGRIKKINSLFQKMIGFDEKDLIGKHLVDFVGPSGLAGVEQHYVNRLKGVDDLSYDTVFLTRNENEIPVHVKVKTGEFQGQRAEIATFIENQ